MARIEYANDVTGSLQEARGSDGRLNVSARADARAYYNSRDREQAYAVTFFGTAVAATEIAVALQNTSATLTMVVSDVTVNTIELVQVEAHLGTPTTLAGGAALVNSPGNENFPSSNVAAITGREGTSGDGVTGVSSTRRIAIEQVGALGNREFEFHDRVRLGQNQAIFLNYLLGTTGNIFGTFHVFFE